MNTEMLPKLDPALYPAADNMEVLIHNLVEEEIERQHMKWQEAVVNGKRYSVAIALLVSGGLNFVAGLLDWISGSLSGIASSMLTVGTVSLVVGLVLWCRHREAERQRLVLLDDSGEVTKEDYSHIRCLS
jgi:hypothetical protein